MTKANDQHHELNIERARDLLSPYLDDEVTEAERVLVEEAISTSAELRQELEQLRQTINLVTALPQMPAPRPFTLSEADVRDTAPGAGGGFVMPFWLRSWLPIAATLLCVVALGGFFLLQFGSNLNGSEPAQIARESAPQPTQAVEAESVEQAAEAPAADEGASEKLFSQEALPPAAPTQTPVEEAEAMEEAAAEEAAPAEPPAEEPAPAEPSANESAAEEEAAMAAQDVTKENAETMAAPAAESAPEGQSSQAGNANRTGEALSNGAGIAVTATPSPAPTPAPLPTATGVPQPAAAEADQEAMKEEEATTVGEAAAPENLSDRDHSNGLEKAEPTDQVITRRWVEIRDQRLQISPGQIQIEGVIESASGLTLQATLERNGQPFDSWADPATLQTQVQPNGQFSFDIQAQTGRSDRDLFALEPASYQVIITSVGTEEPIITSVFFETPSPLTSTPAATFTPAPSPTALALATNIPEGRQTVPSTQPSPPAEPELGRSRPTRLLFTGIGVLAGLIVVGLMVWLIVRKQKS